MKEEIIKTFLAEIEIELSDELDDLKYENVTWNKLKATVDRYIEKKIRDANKKAGIC